MQSVRASFSEMRLPVGALASCSYRRRCATNSHSRLPVSVCLYAGTGNGRCRGSPGLMAASSLRCRRCLLLHQTGSRSCDRPHGGCRSCRRRRITMQCRHLTLTQPEPVPNWRALPRAACAWRPSLAGCWRDLLTTKAATACRGCLSRKRRCRLLYCRPIGDRKACCERCQSSSSSHPRTSHELLPWHCDSFAA